MIIEGFDLPLTGRQEVGVQVTLLDASKEELARCQHVPIYTTEYGFDLVISQKVPGHLRTMVISGVKLEH